VYSRLLEAGVNLRLEELESLRREANAIVGWNLKLAGEMVGLLNLLGAKGITAVPFKGPALVCALYGGLKLRQCRDLDLFVKRELLFDAVSVLETHGYKVDEESYQKLQGASTYGICKDLLLVNSVNHVNIDLHWAACEPAFDETLAASDFWSEATTVMVLDEPVSLPTPENLLVLLVIHGSRHHWNGFKLLCDIGRLLTVYPEINLEVVREKLPGTWRSRLLLIPLALVHDLWNLALPPWVMVLIDSDKTVRDEGRAILERLFAVAPDNLTVSKNEAATLVSRESLRLSSTDGSEERGRLTFQVLKRLVTPNEMDQRFSEMPARFRALLYLVRPIRILKTYGWRLCLQSARKILQAITNG
jgi:hypothetical protein